MMEHRICNSDATENVQYLQGVHSTNFLILIYILKLNNQRRMILFDLLKYMYILTTFGQFNIKQKNSLKFLTTSQLHPVKAVYL